MTETEISNLHGQLILIEQKLIAIEAQLGERCQNHIERIEMNARNIGLCFDQVHQIRAEIVPRVDFMEMEKQLHGIKEANARNAWVYVAANAMLVALVGAAIKLL
jgi:hypothetical protein